MILGKKLVVRMPVSHADVMVLHPDYQHSPSLVTAMATMIASGHYDLFLVREYLEARPERRYDLL